MFIIENLEIHVSRMLRAFYGDIHSSDSIENITDVSQHIINITLTLRMKFS